MSFDVDAADYIARVETAEGPLRSGVQNAVNALVLGLKADGNWHALKASVLMAGPQTLAGCLTPLTGPNPTNFGFLPSDYDPVLGLKGDGIAKRLGSGRNNATDPQDSRHLSVWIASTGELVATSASIGIGQGGSGSSQLARTTNSRFSRLSSAGVLDAGAGTAIATGFVGASRASGIAYSKRLNGSNIQSNTVSQSPLNGIISVFARSDGSGVTPDNFSPERLAWYSIGEAINLELLDSRLATYMAAVASNAAMVKRKHAAAHFFTSRF